MKNHDPQEITAVLGPLLDKVDRLFDTAREGAAFGEPVTVGGQTVLGAAEVFVAVGFGGGGGSSPSPSLAESDSGLAQPTAPTESGTSASDIGAGVGVGGAAHARPVALIIFDGNGVRVEPVVDVTKLALAGITAFGGMIFMAGRMLRAARSK
jgi:uncharacterized spore protein YtfJ